MRFTRLHAAYHVPNIEIDLIGMNDWAQRATASVALRAMQSPEDGNVLRPYHKERDDLTFIATAPMLNTSFMSNGSNSGAYAGAPDGLASYSRPTNRYISADADAALLDSTDHMSTGNFLKGIALSGALQFTSICIAMPFEVGKLLLQVQWVPRQEVWERICEGGRQGEVDDAESEAANVWDEDEGDEQGPEKYFRNIVVPDRAAEPKVPTRATDEKGYVVPRGMQDRSARPEYFMPLVVKGGVWEMIKTITRSKEGWMALWKGAITTFALDTCTNIVQPIVNGFFSLFAPTAMNPMPIAFSPQPLTTLSLQLVSHAITGVVVSPMDLVRTRIIAQTTLPIHRKYKGPIHALRTILREEGGWCTTYLYPLLLVPTILDYFFRTLLSLGSPLLLENVLHLDPTSVPVTYALAELALSTLALGVTLPIETVRRRLQLQSHEPLRPSRPGGLLPVQNTNTARRGLRTCVETRPVPYSGVTEALYRIVVEETSIPQGKDEAGFFHFNFGGLRNLYRGFGMGFTANMLVFVLTLVTGEREPATGWTEM
ncbi:hypothetical protein MVES1_003128 [Malassezia vespertilionis]|uniref:Mitochondrial carrier n=1 Tax=Malassezia vespertilionis TaxID=2020962 RepID=A0A2N1J8W7_9BASI|nr:uncharacterized protein MVES1_003128 [Malassezia vespertilionis]PKI82976.1 hypothetical protein MVES_002969 [Malassezia vespertilionis]WFD07758.1 hypothetical protein MVES1_003128 [Malassezia vespertilionis]